jgi:NADH-quinone oxidoreductase subunit C
MSEHASELAKRIAARFGDRIAAVHERLGQVTVEVPPAHLLEVARALRDEREFRFEQLVDLCGVDYASYGLSEWEGSDAATRSGFSRGVEGAGPGRFRFGEVEFAGIARRFASVVHLLSIATNRRLRLRSFAPDDELPVIPSLTAVWPGANWFEREAFDLFGIVYEGHPDLRRILTDYGFVGHPFRKDFPLIGNVEVRYDPEKGRVVYEPVSIEPRVLVPRVVREDSRYLQGRAEQEAGEGR